MHQLWYKNYRTVEEKKRRGDELRSFRTAFRELSEILDELREKPTNDYASKDWALKMADINGVNRTIDKVKSLIEIKD